MSLANLRLAAVFMGRAVRGLLLHIQSQTRAWLLASVAVRRDDLRSPPDYRLAALRGNRRGLHSIRVNEQWRISSIQDAIYSDLSGCCLTARAGDNSCKNLS